MALLTAFYGLIVFLAAFLLFLAEPMAARQLLPVLGGSAAVWTTCLVFFQAALLAGYAYADWLARLKAQKQAVLHIVLLGLALALLGVHVHPNPAAATWYPELTVFWLLSAIVGVPFFALASTSPLLQAWYSRMLRREPPYRLFALSNAGSLLALAAYPAVIEPYSTLQSQTRAWSTSFFFFAALCGGLAWALRNYPETSEPMLAHKAVPLRLRALWLLLPACSSLLLCAITNHMSQNVAAIPLLWVLPLIAYLLSYMVAFYGPNAYPRWMVLRLTMFSLGVAGYLLYDSRRHLPVQIAVPVFCVLLFLLCWFCHGELYRLRPDARTLTSFYLHIAAGSALGACFAGVVAPVIFRANYELIWGLVLTALLALAVTWQSGWLVRAACAAAVCALVWVGVEEARAWRQDTLVQLRSFYGTLRVTQTHWPPDADTVRTLYHGTIQHGAQFYGGGLRMQPTSYYGANSGAGLAMRLCCSGQAKRVGVVGLGTGTLAAYGRPGDVIRFYELDPLVLRLARNLFTYLRETPAQTDVILGDARASLARETPQRYDVLVLDAFSGDAVPVHLLTAEAIRLYRRHLKPDGILAFNVSSQYLDLAPVLAREAQQAGMKAILVHSSADEKHGLFVADWVLLTTNTRFLSEPEVAARAQPVEMNPRVSLWTDQESSLLPTLKWQPPFLTR